MPKIKRDMSLFITANLGLRKGKGMFYLYSITGMFLLISFVIDRGRTFEAIFKAAKTFRNIFPAILAMLIFVSISLYFVSDEVILTFLGGRNKFLAVLTALLIGSITLMPGFIAFPLCGLLLKKGIPCMVLSAFSTTLMMVGILTYPLEKAYFGAKVTIIRNILGFFTALMVAIMTGIFFGEIF